MDKKSRAESFGEMLADVVIEAAHLTYNAPRGVKIVETCIKVLQKRIEEIKPKKATPEYKKARYGKN
ncbi:hypothetical protein HOD96_03620 [Candidatus Falkowbacteria bacterium]|jgi:hypothetical protein|nr:hypothetical protein [Candidatus Falkowbacteria bacterium]MBT4433018.1 hypothetical protein [Candidatus Falkowbacteria bacterium]